MIIEGCLFGGDWSDNLLMLVFLMHSGILGSFRREGDFKVRFCCQKDISAKCLQLLQFR